MSWYCSYCDNNKENECLGEGKHERYHQKNDTCNQDNLLLSLGYDMAAKKRKKDLMNNNSKVPCESPSPPPLSHHTLCGHQPYWYVFINLFCSTYIHACHLNIAWLPIIQCHTLSLFLSDFHMDKWIYVHKGSTKEVKIIVLHAISSHVLFTHCLHPTFVPECKTIFLKSNTLWYFLPLSGSLCLSLFIRVCLSLSPASRLLHARRSLQPLGFLQRHQGHPKI